MSSINSKSHSCKNPIQSTIHQPLRIRTNKHRCFVFCLGHTSLTCVPGIGKKNKHLLNQSGIINLSTLYRKYRSINNIQRFKQWLENDIGFTSYQAKMTTCGIGSKLGEIKEINTGLTTICCPAKERREELQRLFSKNKNIEKRNRSVGSEKNKTKEIKKPKIENEESFLSPDIISSQNDQVFTSSKENLPESRKQSYSSTDISSESNSRSESNSYQQNKPNKSSIDHSSSFDEKKPVLHSNLDDSSNDKCSIDKRLDALQDKKDSTKSILHSPQSTSSINTNVFFAAIKQKQYQQQTENKPLKITSSLDTNRDKTTINKDTDSDENDNKGAEAIKRSRSNEFQEEVSKAVSQIMKQAAHIVHDKIEPLPIDSVLTAKPNKSQEILNDQDSNTINKSVKPSPTDNTKMRNNRVQHELPTLTTNKSSESTKKQSNKKKSLSTLSSLSDSNQSINRIPSSIDKIQSNSSNIDRFEEETEKLNDIIMPTNSTRNNKFESIPRSLTVSSPNIAQFPIEHNKQSSVTNTTLFNHSKTQSLKKSQTIDKNVSEIGNSEYQSISAPMPCYALWDNISNEKILFQHKKPRLTFLKKGQSDRKLNQNNHNQNYHSSTTLFTYLTRQSYLKQRENLNEHILYIKQIKTLYKR